VFLLLLACTHAFASTSSEFTTSFLPRQKQQQYNSGRGRNLPHYYMVVPSQKEWAANAWGLNNLRGGEAAAAAAAATASTSTNSPNTLQCVMQIPRPATSATNQHDNSSNKGKPKTKTTPLRVTALSSASTKKKKPTPASSSSSPSPVEYVAETKLPTDIGQFQLRAYRVPGAPIGQEPCVIYSRDRPPFGQHNVPVRIHDQCLTSEVFRSQRCVKM
jgi:GTP cyclohydrolase II